MKIQFWTIGKGHDTYIAEGVEQFTKRIKNYYPVAWNVISLPRNTATLPEKDLKEKEATMLMQQLKKDDYLILLDERGKMLSSNELATFIEQRANESEKNLVFLIGGAFGVAESIAQRADFKWSLSRLVFPHQLVRLILSEQIYRACSIIRNEKYHHE